MRCGASRHRVLQNLQVRSTTEWTLLTERIPFLLMMFLLILFFIRCVVRQPGHLTCSTLQIQLSMYTAIIYRKVKVHNNSFLALALHGGKHSASRPSRLTPSIR
jgi:hypothetical protein